MLHGSGRKRKIDTYISIDDTRDTPLPKKRTLASVFTQQRDLITILIGDEQRAFHVHKQLLIDKSPYFETCLKDCWSTTKDTVEVKDATVEGFGVVIDAMYTGKLPDYLQDRLVDGGQFALLFATYRVADILMMTDLQNQIVDPAVSGAVNGGFTFSLSTVRDLCEQNLGHTKLYELVFKQAVRKYITKPPTAEKCKGYMEKLADYPQVYADVLVSINAYLHNPWPRLKDIDICQYHIHQDNESCKSQSTP